MALIIYSGKAGAGKTYALLQEIIRQSEEHRDRTYYVIVPEQFTMQTQRELVHLHPRKAIMNLDVTSLMRLAFRVFEETGEEKDELLEEIGKSFLLEKIALEIKPKLRYFRDTVTKPEYIAEMKAVISELMLYDVAPEQLSLAAGENDEVSPEKAFGAKLRDVAAIYETFLRRLEGSFMTAEEIPDRLLRIVGKSALLKDAVFAFDGFTGFTPVQVRLIRQLLSSGQDVYVTVTADPDQNLFGSCRASDLFSMSFDMVCQLKKAAEETGTAVLPVRTVDGEGRSRHASSPALAHLAKNLFRKNSCIYEGDPEGIEVLIASGIREEVSEAARRICRLVREEGLRYRDIAIVTGDLSSCGRYVRELFGRLGIPYFIDEKRSLIGNPFIESLRAAVSVCTEDYSYESIFRFMKCGMSGFPKDLTDRMENYVLGRGIRGRKRWNEDFIYPFTNEDPAEVPELNAFRKQICELFGPLSDVFSRRGSTVREKSEALYDFCVRNRSEEKLQNYTDRFQAMGRPDLVREYSQVYPYVCGFLDKLTDVLGEEKISMRDYLALLEAGFAEARVGIIPPGNDRVVVGDVERSRIPEIRVLFFIGMNEGIVPAVPGRGGILSDNDREGLSGAGIRLRPSAREQIAIERFYLYTVMSKPSERLIISMSTSLPDGSEAYPSYAIHHVMRMFPGLVPVRPSHDIRDLTERKTDGISNLARGLQKMGKGVKDPAFLELFSFLRDDPEYSEQVQTLLGAAGKHAKEDRIGRAAAKALYGDVLVGSASRLERFCECEFRHFLDYGLRLQSRPSYEFTGLDFGNIVHRSLELYAGYLRRPGFHGTADEHTEAVREAFAETLRESGSETVIHSSKRSEYQTVRIRRFLESSVQVLAKMQAEGDFTPCGAEMSFKEQGIPESMQFRLPDNTSMMLTGRIDRVDTVTVGDAVYVSVTDYKTGDVRYEPAKIYYGTQLQLALYLNAALELLHRENPNVFPAGMFYFRIQDPVLKYKPGEDAEGLMERRFREMGFQGILLDDPAVMDSFDREARQKGKSELFPIEYKKDGTPAARSGIVSGEDFRTITEYARRKAASCADRIMRGYAAVRPYRTGNESACTWCPYRAVCGFDEKIPGYRYRLFAPMNQAEALIKMREDPDELDG